jgi:hypothetical protein
MLHAGQNSLEEINRFQSVMTFWLDKVAGRKNFQISPLGGLFLWRTDTWKGATNIDMKRRGREESWCESVKIRSHAKSVYSAK